MDDELFGILYHIAWKLWPRREKSVQYAARTIVLMYLWSVIRNKPRQWVCYPRNLPAKLRDQAIPGRSQFGRRLNSPAVQLKLLEMEEYFREKEKKRKDKRLLGCWILDAKPLAISPYSKDKDARWGWACEEKARGYKVFALSDIEGRIISWKLNSMNVSEPLVARDLIEKIDRPGYLLGDSIYDANALHELTALHDVQLIAPRKQPGGNIGKRARHPNRLHSIAMLESIHNTFGPSMYAKRTTIERAFSRMACSRVGLDHLPGFVRTIARVTPWVRGKMILYSIYNAKDLQ